jgi:protein-tyrosine kinase
MSRFADALRRAEAEPVAPTSGRDTGTLRVFKPRAAAGGPIPAEPPRPHLQPPAAPPPAARAASIVPDRLEWYASDSPDKFFAREQYNRLAAVLHEAQCARGIKVVLVTSAVPREGKTLTIANLSLTLSESYQRRVLLIDADLRRPMVHTLFGVANDPGLTGALGGGPLPLTPATSRLSLLTAGDGGSDPMTILASDAMRQLVTDARAGYDWVLVDTPPIGLLPDASVLTSMADGALLVALAGRTPYDAIQRAADAVGRDRIFGVVLNGMHGANLPHVYDHSYYGPAERPRC